MQKLILSLKKNLENKILEEPDRQVFFFDESRFGTHSRLGHGWFKTGSREPVKKCLGYKNFYVYTAASPQTGEEFSIMAPNVNTDWMNLYLQKMSQWLNNKPIFIVMDQAGWHITKKLIVPDNIKIIFLPPYSPELNPVERLWKYIKDNVLKNALYEEIELLEDDLCDFIKTISADTIKSVCSAGYMSCYL